MKRDEELKKNGYTANLYLKVFKTRCLNIMSLIEYIYKIM